MTHNMVVIKLVCYYILIMKQVSVILPCLNEEDGVGIAIEKILNVFQNNSIDGEIIVVDNGSTDNTKVITLEYPVVYLYESKRGYGNAYKAGFAQATGQHVIMGDPDSSYDFNEIPKFLKLLETNDVVLGSRFSGVMEEGAMPFLHRYVGNPGILFLFRVLYGLKLTEPSTGFVGLRNDIIPTLNLKQPGMEFSSEVLVRVKQNNYLLHETPINYHRRSGTSKLRTFRDGFRHLWFLLKTKWA